jgi:transglutaminase-like putative cysteine protease
MRRDEQMPRHCFYWLLVANVLLLLPHIERLPPWLLAVYIFCAGWRWKIFHNSWEFPNGWIKAFLVVVAMLGIRSHYKSMLGIEPTVALLIAGCSLKLIEMKTRRDVYFLIFLGYFVALTAFLFNRDWTFVLIMLVPLIFLTSALLALHQPGDGGMRWKTLRQSSLLWLQSLPIMLVLFLIVPRISPFWQVPVPSASAKTGISDAMSPGSFGNLSNDDALAFRVEFKGDIPAKQELYFRSIVMEDFDGKTWKPAPESLADFAETGTQFFNRLKNYPAQRSYRVIVEPSNQRWLFALDMPRLNDFAQQLTSRRTVMAREEIYRPLSYRIDQIDLSYADKPDNRMLARLLNLPGRGGEQARELAEELRRASTDSADYVNRVLSYFTSQPFYYTLQPPLLPDDSIDEFLFESRRGFCEHYASSFVYLMRAAGVPARVVTGYQGGEVNPLNNILMVRQYDAHAWAEVWLEGQGWLRVDPTAAVAPDRILRGLEQTLPEEFMQDNFALANNLRQMQWLNTIRLRMAATDYYWTRWVLDYRGEQQMNILQRLLGEVNWQRMLFFMAAILLPLLGFVFWYLNRGSGGVPLTPLQRLYRRFEQLMANYGYPRNTSEAPLDYAQRLSLELPQHAAAIQAFSRLYSQQAYANIGDDQLAKMKRLLKMMRRQVLNK